MIRRYYEPLDDYQAAREVLMNANRCAAYGGAFLVKSKTFKRQCKKPTGHGPNGEYCKVHADWMARSTGEPGAK